MKGTDKKMAFGEVALAAYVAHKFPTSRDRAGAQGNAFHDPSNFTFPAGCHICEVEIDPDTGVTKIASWVAVDDFGTVINPMIVEGQVHGGIVQGIGQALTEGCVYDSGSGQLLTGSYMDYCMPRARRSVLQARFHRDQVPIQPAGHQGLRRSRCDCGSGSGDECVNRRARRQGLADAGDLAGHLECIATHEKSGRVRLGEELENGKLHLSSSATRD